MENQLYLIANHLVPDNEVWVSKKTFDNPFLKSTSEALKPAHNNARDEICAIIEGDDVCLYCKHHIDSKCEYHGCFDNQDFEGRKLSPVA